MGLVNVVVKMPCFPPIRHGIRQLLLINQGEIPACICGFRHPLWNSDVAKDAVSHVLLWANKITDGGGGNSTILDFHPESFREDEPILTSIFFKWGVGSTTSMGLVTNYKYNN